MKKMPTVRALASFGERQGSQAVRAGRYIERLLRAARVPYQVEVIAATLPKASARLLVDGKRVRCAPTSFVGGRIAGNASIVSSLIPTRYLLTVPNINFNPQSDALSLPNFYFAPSVAVRRREVPRIIKAHSVKGVVRVEKRKYSLPQILVGNRKDPANVVFTHYDSIGPGAMDNASGTAVCLAALTSCPDLLENTLFVFDPNEELSYDRPTYWGHGYRVFEKRHQALMRRAAKVISVDSVGNGKPRIFRDAHTLNLAFPIAHPERVKGQLLTIGGDIGKMMEIYQSDKDLPRVLSEKYLEETQQLLVRLLRGKA
jgi:hypothetical protein